LSCTDKYIIDAKDISYTYKGADKPSVNSISLQIEKGEIYGIIGPNGAGKTTLISIIATLIKPAAGGSINICGINLNSKPADIRKQLGLIPQNIALFPELTGRENLFYFSTMYGLKKKQIKKEIEKKLEMFGLKDKADKRVSMYSGGMQRRINLLAGILHKPSLLLLDEPTVGIDAQSRNLIMENLILLKEQGISMIYTSHYMEEIEKLCSRISVIDNGRIIATGNPQTLVDEDPESSNLSELFLNLTGKNLRD
jgi:ABC-2 type transport system ATP-binding protein